MQAGIDFSAVTGFSAEQKALYMSARYGLFCWQFICTDLLLDTPIKKITLPNNLELAIFDRTSHYYGGFYQVSLEVVLDLPVCDDFCPDGMVCADVRNILGPVVTFRRILERMGVHQDEISTVRESLMQQFLTSSAAYLGAPSFPSGLIAAELRKTSRRPITSQLRFTAS